MTGTLRVFVSSVQKELEDERVIVQNLLNTDAFLSAHCAPVLYEFEPASPHTALEGGIKSLDECQVYLLIVGTQYGTVVGDVSITHAEYRRAREKGLPVLAFIKGERTVVREAGTDSLLRELDADGPKYKRFGNVIELQKEVRAALVALLKERFGITPSSDENEMAAQTIEATSTFESQTLTRVRWRDLDHDAVRQLVSAAEGRDPAGLTATDLLGGASLRGLVWHDPHTRVVVSSPGLPPAPITLASLRRGKYRPCSRNPVLAQCLSYFHRIEERGSGFRRMRDQMLDHGLDQPLLGTDTGYFQVTFPGPGENLDRLRAPETQLRVTPAIEAQLNDRQRKILAQALENGSVTAGWCLENLGVVKDTAHRDLVGLVDLGLLARRGSGRGTRYVLEEGRSTR